MSASPEIPKVKRKRAVRLAEGQYFFIKEHKNKSGSISYHVEGTPPPTSENPNPERVRQNRTTLAEAQNLLNDLELAAQNIEVTEKIILQATRLNSQQLKKAEIAFDELAPGDAQDIVEAVRFWKQHHSGINKTMRLREALARCTADKINAGRAKATIDCYRFAVNSFLKLFGEPTGQFDAKGMEMRDIPIANITRQQIKRWVESFAVRENGLNKRRALSAVLTWCVDNEHLKTNWAIGVRLEEVSPKPKHISLLINAQSQAFLNKAVTYEEGVAMPYVVVCLFGGIRPEEAPQIEPEEVNLEKRFIRLCHTKTRRKRIVELSENATAMLQFYWKNRKGSFRIKNFQRIIAALKAAAGFRERSCIISERPDGWESFPRWPNDVMRHTALSNKLTATNDVMETTRWGGNSPQVFYEHYHGLVSADQAAQFWSMLPDSMPRTPELMERIRLELVEWGLLKKDAPLPPAPEVPQLTYPERKRKDDLLKIPLEELKELIWKHSAKTVAKKVGCSAVFLLHYCRHKDIPTPPRGYWAQLKAGKATAASAELKPRSSATRMQPQPSGGEGRPDTSSEDVTTTDGGGLTPVTSEPKRSSKFKVVVEETLPAAPRTEKGLIDWRKISTEDLRRWIWTRPTRQIAMEWGVWEDTIRKQLFKREIPSPPRGYWAKVAAGHPVVKPDFLKAA